MTNWVLSALGGVLFVCALVRLGVQLFPGRGEASVRLAAGRARRAKAVRRSAAVSVETRPSRFIRRMQIPEKVHPYSAGVRGGIVGGIAMAVVALAYGVVSGRGIWYPINLLAAMMMTSFGAASTRRARAVQTPRR